MFGVAKPSAFRSHPERVQVVLQHVGEHEVLLVRDAELAEAVAVGEIGDRVHLVGGRRRPAAYAGALERQRDDRVARALVRRTLRAAQRENGRLSASAARYATLVAAKVAVGRGR